MKCNNNNHNNYKKPTFFERISKWFDKLLGITPEDYLTDEEADYVMDNFDKIKLRMRR